jgi:hypothetical protein
MANNGLLKIVYNLLTYIYIYIIYIYVYTYIYIYAWSIVSFLGSALTDNSCI